MSSGAFRSVSIDAYRGLRDVHLEDCARVNLLVGANNCGKTSALEALMLLCNPTDLQTWESTVAFRGPWPLADMIYSAGRLSRLTALRGLFPGQGEGADAMRLRATGTAPVSALRATAETIVGVIPARPDGGPEGIIESTRPGSPQRQLAESADRQPGLAIELELAWRTPPALDTRGHLGHYRMVLWERGWGRADRTPPGATLPARYGSPISHRSDGHVTRTYSDLVRAGLKAQTVELLQQVDPSIQDIEIVTPVSDDEDPAGVYARTDVATVHVRLNGAGLLPLQSLGDGVRRALHLAGLIGQLQGGVLLLDEIEVGMHTSVLGPVFSWLVRACQTLNVQVFATTHSLEAVDAIIAATPSDELALYRIMRDRARRIGGEALRTARLELGNEVR